MDLRSVYPCVDDKIAASDGVNAFFTVDGLLRLVARNVLHSAQFFGESAKDF